MHVGVYEAKARLSELIDEARRGGEVVLTKHGVPVARLVRLEGEKRSVRAKLVAEILSYSKTLRGPKLDLRRAIEAGRD